MYYYRTTPDRRRIVFGGRVSASETDPRASALPLYQEMCRLFPEVRGYGISHSWSGTVAYTFDEAPHTGIHDGIHYAMGYCGSGVTRSIYFGRQLAKKILNEAGADTIYDRLEFRGRPFYTGNLWFMNAMLRWNALLDRLDGNS